MCGRGPPSESGAGFCGQSQGARITSSWSAPGSAACRARSGSRRPGTRSPWSSGNPQRAAAPAGCRSAGTSSTPARPCSPCRSCSRRRSRRVDETMSDWLDLVRLDPAYRAHFPDGSTLDVIADPARMADEVIARLRATGGRRLPALRRLRRAACGTCSATTSSTGTWTRPATCSTATCCGCSARRVPAAGHEDRRSSSAIPVPAGSSRSSRCTRASHRPTRSRSTRSSRTSTPSQASTSRAAASTRYRSRSRARPRSTA